MTLRFWRFVSCCQLGFVRTSCSQRFQFAALQARSCQKIRADRALENASPDDLIVISEVDEIPRAKVLSSFNGDLAALELDLFYYRLNCKNLKGKITGPMLIRRRHLTHPQTVRERARRYWEDGTTVLPDAGWHFSCCQIPSG